MRIHRIGGDVWEATVNGQSFIGSYDSAYKQALDFLS